MPVISLAVVTKGPDAMAGSTFIFLKKAGANVPMVEAMVMATTIAIPTTNPMIGFPCQK